MFKKILLLLLLTAAPALAQIGPIQGHSFLGGTQAKTQGLTSSNYLNGIIPHATISVYYTGTTTLVPGNQIFSNSTGTVLGNPFTSNNVTSVNPGGYLFFISLSVPVDVVGSGGISPNTYPVPVPLCVYCFASQAGGGGGSGSVGPGIPPSFPIYTGGSTGPGPVTSVIIQQGGNYNECPSGFNFEGSGSGASATPVCSNLGGTFQITGYTSLVGGSGYSNLSNVAAVCTGGCTGYGFAGIYTAQSVTTSIEGDTNLYDDPDIGLQYNGPGIALTDTLGANGIVISSFNNPDIHGSDDILIENNSDAIEMIDPNTTDNPGIGPDGVLTIEGGAIYIAAGAFSKTPDPLVINSEAFFTRELVPSSGNHNWCGSSFTSSQSILNGCQAWMIQGGSSGTTYTVEPAANNGFTIAGNTGLKLSWVTFCKSDSAAGSVTLIPTSGDTIDGTTSLVLTTQYQCAQLMSDGDNNWYQVNNGGSGSGGSVGTAGQLQMVGLTAGSFAASAATDNGSIFAIAEPVTVTSAGASQLGFTYNATPIVPGSSTTFVIGANSSGQGVMSETGGAAARICDATNGVCGGGSSGYTNLTGSISETTVSAINSACGSGTYYATTPLSIATGGTVSCPVQFSKSGLWTIASGQTVTFTYPITETDAPTQHFAGSGAVALAGQNAPVEWWGAVADWNWGTLTGTDNHVPIQACLNDLAAGNCLLGAGGYSVGSTTITITRNSIGLKGINHGSYSSNLGTTWTDATAPYASQLISTSASADVIDVGGTSNGAVIQWTTVESIGIERSVTPSGTAAGLSCKFDVGGIFRDLDSDDSIYDYYIEQCSGHETYGFINANARWGQNGVTVTGSVYGFYINAAASPNQLNSLNLINVAADNKGTGASGDTAYGIYETGGILSDLFVDGYAGVNGLKTPIYIDGTSATTAIDMFFSNLVLDAPKAGPCIYLNMSGVSLSTFPTQSFVNVKCQGGSGTIPYAVDIENAGSVQFSNLSILQISPTTAALYVHSTNSFTMTGSTIAPSSAVPAEILDHSSYSPQTGNNYISGNSGTTNIVSVLSGTTNSLIGNVFSGIATCGYTLDASSTHNHYANQNSFESVGGSITTAICDSGTDNQSPAGTTTNALTAAASGGASPGSTFNGSAAVTFDYHSLGAAPLASPTFTGTVTIPAATLSGITGSTQCLNVNSSGVVSGTGSTCGSGGSGTNVQVNGGSTLTTSSQTGVLPYACADTSGSGTAQSCTTSPSFTPQAGNCVEYSTTTANTGAGLTLNIDSFGAKSAAVASSSGWTTTLTAGQVPSGTPLLACYTGTNWNVALTGIAASGSGAMTNITNSVVFTGCTVTGNVCTPTGSVASIDIASIPSTGNHLEIIMTGTGNFGNTHWLVNGDTGADYGSQYVQGAASTASAGQVTITTNASCFGVNAPFTGVDMKVPFYSVASPYQVLNSETRQLGGALTTGTMFTNDSGCFWKAPSPAAINEIKLVPTSNFDTSVHVTVYLIQ